MDEPVVIGGQDLRSHLQACDSEFQQLTCIDFDGIECWAARVYLAVLRNKLDRFAKSVRMATSPKARFREDIGDPPSREETKRNLAALEQALSRIRALPEFSQRLRSIDNADEASPRDFSSFHLVAHDAVKPVTSHWGDRLAFTQLGFAESTLGKLLDSANYEVAIVYERFSYTYGPQKILATTEAAELVRLMDESWTERERSAMKTILGSADIYLNRAVEGFQTSSLAAAPQPSDDGQPDSVLALSEADFAKRRKRGFGPYFFEDKEE